MSKRRFLVGTWALAAAAALLVPAAARAQVVFFGTPGFGRPPVTLPSYYSSLGVNAGFPYYYGSPGYSSYPYSYGGFPYSYGSMPYAYGGYPYAGYSTSTTIPFYQGFQPLGSSMQSYGLGSGLAAPAYPRMRNATYPPLTGYTAGVGLGSLSTAGSLGQRATYVPSASAGTTASLGSFMPCAYAGLVCGSLNFAPVAYDPAGYAATAAVVLNPPPRARQALYPPDPGIRTATLGSYAAGQGPRRAEVDVLLPSANAEVWFDGVRMRPSGKERRFFTPALEPGSRYTYQVRARWQDNGQAREQTRSVYLRPGDVLEVDFNHGTARE